MSDYSQSMAHLTPEPTEAPPCIFKATWDLQRALDRAIERKPVGNKHEQALQITRPLAHEVFELEHQLERYWKFWKKTANEPDQHEVKMEIIDCYHFLMRLTQLYFESPEEFYAYYAAKNKENHARIERKY